MKTMTRALLCLSFVTLIAACGDKKPAGAAGSGGTAGTTAGTGAGTGAAGTTAGGAGAAGGLACPVDPGTTMCGTSVCPALDATQAMTCVQTCCLDANTCGTLSGLTNSKCAGAIQADADCPNETVFGQAVTGCCVAGTNACGIDATVLGMGCVRRESAAPLATLAPKNCDGTTPEGGAGTGAAGTTAGDGAAGTTAGDGAAGDGAAAGTGG